MSRPRPGHRHARSPGRGSLVATAMVVVSVATITSAGLAGHGADAGPRQARVTPPPTPVPPFGQLSPFPTTLITPAPSTQTPPPLRANAALLKDLGAGQVLLSLRPRLRTPIASLTKIMTALLCLERSRTSGVATVEEDAVGVIGSVLGLQVGERLAVRDLLYALLLQSSNDAAVALADQVSGSESAFVGAMNARAAELGMRDSTFFSPNGLDDRGHSSARDLAILTERALRRPLFARIARTRTYDIPGPGGSTRHVQNRNALLWLYPGAEGVKTGFTTPAGFALVAVAERGGRRLMAIVLQEPNDQEAYDDAAALLNYGFNAFRPLTILQRGQVVGLVSVDGQAVAALAVRNLSRLVPKNAPGRADVWLIARPGIHAPVQAGQRVGTASVVLDGKLAGAVPVVAATDVAPSPPVPPGSGGPTLPLDPGHTAAVLTAILRSMLGPFL